jgi:hypothetical protein
MSQDQTYSIEGLSCVTWVFRRYSSSPGLENEEMQLPLLRVRVGSGVTPRALHAPTHGVSGNGGRLSIKGVDEQAITIYCTPSERWDGKALQERSSEICIRTKRGSENCWRQSLPNSDRIIYLRAQG